MSRSAEVIRDFVKANSFHTLHNSWEESSNRKVSSANARRESTLADELKTAQLAERRKRLGALLDAETEGYLKELESLRAKETDEERLQTLRDRVAELREQKEARKIILKCQPKSCPAEPSSKITDLCNDLREQLQLKQEQLQYLQEREKQEDAARESMYQERMQKAEQQVEERTRARQEHSCQLRQLGIEAEDRKQRLMKKQQDDGILARVELEYSLAQEAEEQRLKGRRDRNALGSERRAEMDERETRAKRVDFERQKDLQSQNEYFNMMQEEHQQRETQRKVQLRGDQLADLRRGESEREAIKQLQIREGLRYQLQEDSQMEEGRKYRENVHLVAQTRLKEQVEVERQRQMQDKVLQKQQEKLEKEEEAEFSRRQAEDWLGEQEDAKQLARKRKELYAKQLQDQIDYKSLHHLT